MAPVRVLTAAKTPDSDASSSRLLLPWGDRSNAIQLTGPTYWRYLGRGEGGGKMERGGGGGGGGVGRQADSGLPHQSMSPAWSSYMARAPPRAASSSSSSRQPVSITISAHYTWL